MGVLFRVLCLSLLVVLSFSGCAEEKKPLKIGYVGGLTGRVAGLGVAGRDAVLLAVEERNRQGGINGQPVELVVKDDKQDKQTAQQVVTELVNEGVIAIIGHMTSSMSVVTQPIIDRSGVVMISPTTKTEQLSNIDDHFFRVTPQLSINATKLAKYVTSQLTLNRFAVVYDTNNKAFTENWLESFRDHLQANGGEVTHVGPFASSPETSFLELAQKVVESDAEGLLIVSSAMDAALTAQQVRKLGSNLPIFTSEWSFTSDVISFGGKAVEGMTSFHSFNAGSQQPRYLAFKEAFQKRFGYTPSFATVLAYDSTDLLFRGLEKNPQRKGLKEALLSLGRSSGLQSEFTLNRYGDVDRHLFLTVIRDGAFLAIESR